ncbi:class I SAM-dependent methyltransferase [Ferrimonas marina]|uniref:Ubiquinone/menaquinone biosynthesis C-methylase UbiE n=1 Tax=Ferrimonas marina TaxID=299255 RepID=A0A1M5MF71_9GAMM|nr:class I SAM-dependent methyltransferase [Ferrimonas marina]SHG75871.1 Ubiquinone/menaquinone biosynthesis C-methylase UbiE [Ferrimonas marina]
MNCCVALYRLPWLNELLQGRFHPGGEALSLTLAQGCLVHRDSRVLDLAAGTGQTALSLQQQLGCEVIALDAGQVDPQSQLTQLQADAHTLPLADQSMDAVLCECALSTFAQPLQVLKECYRVLKPRAWLGLSDMVLTEPLPDALNTTLTQALCLSGARSPEATQALLQQAGFGSIRYRDCHQELRQFVAQIRQRLEWLPAPTALQLQAAQFSELAERIEAGQIRYGAWFARKENT